MFQKVWFTTDEPAVCTEEACHRWAKGPLLAEKEKRKKEVRIPLASPISNGLRTSQKALCPPFLNNVILENNSNNRENM